MEIPAKFQSSSTSSTSTLSTPPRHTWSRSQESTTAFILNPFNSFKMPTKPNIIFILADDHAAKAISAYGAGINHTPNMDRLAKEGMKFNHAYVNNSICTPSRAAILTGTHSHVNGVMTLASVINKHLPNVAKQLRTGGYQTGIIGKWHLGDGKDSQPTGFDVWDIFRGQGEYFDPEFMSANGNKVEKGYATDLVGDKSLEFMKNRDKSRPFFLMSHHKAPHRTVENHPRHNDLYKEEIIVPETFDDDYRNRAKAAAAAKTRIESDLFYADMGLVQPDGDDAGELMGAQPGWEEGAWTRKVPFPEDVSGMKLECKDTGEIFTFKTRAELKHFKYQRYIQRYLRTVQAVDDNVGRILDYLDEEGIAEDTVIMYSSDQGFFLGEHGWFDKRFIYEESFQMPFLIRYPRMIKPGSVCDDIISNVDFAPTWLNLAGITIPSYMQGKVFTPLLKGETPDDWQKIAYHRYWMHRDEIHNVYAHYGVRNQRYKLIYWYMDNLDLPGTKPGGGEPEWELFDCEKDPLELFNCYSQSEYAEVVREMTILLENKMREIGDEPRHKLITE
jgi:arylsulfatase A-like enzyme